MSGAPRFRSLFNSHLAFTDYYASMAAAPPAPIDLEGLYTEATFAGPNSSDGNYKSPEDWVDRIEALARIHNWTDVRTATKAIGFLRGEAAVWFNKALPAFDQASHTQALGSWLAFKRLFQSGYFTKAVAGDVAADFYTLQQKESESVFAFFNRCAATLDTYAELLPAIPVSDAQRDHFLGNLTDVGLAAPAAVVVTAAQHAQLGVDFSAAVAPVLRAATRLRFQGVGLAVFSNGLRNSTFATKARTLVREGKTPIEVRDYVVAMEKSAHKPSHADVTVPGSNGNRGNRGGYRGRGNNNNNNNNNNRPNNSGNGNNSSGQHHAATSSTAVAGDTVSAHPDSDAAAFAARGTGGRGRGRGGRGRLDRSGPPPSPCRSCGENHWHAFCPRRAALAGPPAVASSLDVLLSYDQGNM